LGRPLGSPTRKDFTSRGQILLHTVDELIDQSTYTWDEDLIRSIFISYDAENILRIPLSEYMTDDFVSWNKTKIYMLSVCSAYYVEWDHQFGAKTRGVFGSGI
jgi:hypothetical protein